MKDARENALGIRDQRILITGAASGIGFATARFLAAAGAKLTLLDINPHEVRDAAQRLPNSDRPPLWLTVDVSNEAQVSTAFQDAMDQWGALDAVVHSAGVMRDQRRDVLDITLDSWEFVVRVNLTGSFLVAREAARVMIPREQGTIVLIGSGGGVVTPSGSLSYGASKGGVNGFALTLEEQLHPRGIRVHNFCPGSVATPLVARSLDEALVNGGSPESVKALKDNLTSADDIGRAIGVLLSPHANHFRGAIFSR